MNKRIVALLMALCLVCLTACGGNAGVDDTPSPSNSIEPTEPPSESTVEPSVDTPTAPPAEEPTSTIEPTVEPPVEPSTEPAQSTDDSNTSTPTPTTETKPNTTTATQPPKPVHTHSYASAVTKQATCDANGMMTYTCSCGDSYTEAIKATGHNYSSTVVTEPTCVEVGSRLYTCANCGNVYTETIPANGHSYVTKQEVVEHSEQVQTGTRTVNDYAQVTLYGCRACDFTTHDPDELLRHTDVRYTSDKCAGVGYWSKTTTEVVGTHEEPVYSNRYTGELVTIRVCSICGATE